MEEKTVLQALPSLNQGGVEHYIVSLTPLLMKHGIRPVVISAGGVLQNELSLSGVSHINMDIGRKSLSTFGLIPSLRKLLIKEKVQLVHVHSRVPAWIFLIACRNICPVLFSPHGKYSCHMGSSVVKMIPHLLVGAVSLKKHFMEQFKIPESRFRYVPYGIDTEWFETGKKRTDYTFTRFCAAGRFSSVKGFDILIKAFDQAEKDGYHNWNLKIAGDGEEKAFLREMVRKHNLENRISFCGQISDMREFYRSSDILVISSRREGLPLTLLEAMSCGLPAVATAAGDIPEVLDENCGFSALVENPDSLACQIKAVLNLNSEQYRKMSESAVEKVRSGYSLSAMTAGTVKVYHEILRSL